MIHEQFNELSEEERLAVQQPLETGWVVQGPKVAEFEKSFCDYTGAGHALASTSCTTALQMALMALEIGPCDEVILPPFTWVATANAIELSGAKPVFVDIDLQTFNINVNRIEDAITPRTRAIMPVSLFGLSADINPIMEMAQSRNLRVIEDDACALGAWYHASKHALEGWSDCLRLELADFGIHVVVVQPGIIRTNFAETMQEPLLERSGNGPYGQLTKILLEGFADIYDARRSSSPNLVGSTIAAAACAANPRSRYVVG